MRKGRELHWEKLGTVYVGDQLARSSRVRLRDVEVFYALGPIREREGPPYERVGLLWSSPWQLDLEAIWFDGNRARYANHALGVFDSEAAAKAAAQAHEQAQPGWLLARSLLALWRLRGRT